MSKPAVVTGAGHAFPRISRQEDLWNNFFSTHYDNSPIARRLFSAVGIQTRHAVADPVVDDVSGWSTAARMRRYIPEALPLAKIAVANALSSASLDPADVGMFAVASCTGYATPGLDTLIARDLGMADSVQRLLIGHMGCYAALPSIGTLSDFVLARQQPAVLVCVELASLHAQPPTNEIEQMVSHALFSDAASAIVMEPGARQAGLQVVDVAALTDAAHGDMMTWEVTDLGFRMGLSERVPDVLALHVRPVIDQLLDRHELSICDVAAWAAHPGGPRILDVIAAELELKPEDLAESRSVLAGHGNCSSATVLVVLDEIRKSRLLQSGQHVIALAFGPGLTLYAVLLRAC